MNNKKMQDIKDKYILNDIKENINSIIGISILYAYKSADVSERYLKVLNDIYKIEFPISFTKELGNSNFEYIEFLYDYLQLPLDDCKWLIPNFNGSNWWVELRINNLYNFINYYYPSNKSLNLTVFDTTNNILFDIENGEDTYEYRIIPL